MFADDKWITGQSKNGMFNWTSIDNCQVDEYFSAIKASVLKSEDECTKT